MKTFRGLTYHGTPLVFDKDPPHDAGYLVFLSPDQFARARRAGIEVCWLKASDKDDRAYCIIGNAPEKA